MLWLSLELTIAWINRRSWNHVVLLINKRRRFDILGHPGFFERVPSVDSSPQCFWFWGIFIYHNNVPKQRWTKSSWDVKVPFVILRCQMYPNVSKKCFQQGGEYIYIYTCMYVYIYLEIQSISSIYGIHTQFRIIFFFLAVKIQHALRALSFQLHPSRIPSMTLKQLRWKPGIARFGVLGRCEKTPAKTIPIPSMYGIFTYIWLIFLYFYGKCR